MSRQLSVSTIGLAAVLAVLVLGAGTASAAFFKVGLSAVQVPAEQELDMRELELTLDGGPGGLTVQSGGSGPAAASSDAAQRHAWAMPAPTGSSEQGTPDGAPVPEPAALVLLGAGLVGVALRRLVS